MTEYVAAIDCGSNSTRLLIADATGHAAVREMRITRLSEGVDAGGTLTPRALERTMSTLSEYRRLMDEHHVTHGVVAATSAVRDAINRHEFIDAAREVTGLEVRVVTGDEEATFTYEGATADLAPDNRITVVLDIGGGSTELAMRRDDELISFSMQLGCVRVTERVLGRDVVDETRAAAAKEMITAELDRAFAARPQFAAVRGNVRLVGVAGTVATLAQLVAGIGEYSRDAVHHHELSREVVERWRARLSALPPEARLQLPGMVAGREDVLHAGLFVLEAVMDRFGATSMVSSENDILDGMIAAILRNGYA